MQDRATKAGEVLDALSTSLNHMMELLNTTVSMIRPPSSSTLPTVTATLSGIAQATEHAALQVLDEAEALQDDQQHLNHALTRLSRHLPPGNVEAQAAWKEATAYSSAVSARAMKFISAMEFQDLANQHIDMMLQSVEEVRGRLRAVLCLFDVAPDAATEALDASAKLGHPAQPIGSRQALADQLLAELR